MADPGIVWLGEMKNGGMQGRVGHTSVVMENKLWVFGGYFRYGSCIGGLRCLDLDTLEWGCVADPFEPEPRAWHASALLGSSKWLIFGGFNGATYLNDVHVLTVTDAHGTISWDRKTRVKGRPPSPKQNAALEVVNGTVYIFGGYSQGKCVAELHTLTATTTEDILQWGTLTLDLAHAPSRRCGHSTWVVDDRYIYLFGGYDSGMYCLDTGEKKWLEVQVQSDDVPAPRRLAGSVVVPPHFVWKEGRPTTLLLLQGGLCDHTNTTYGDSWVFDYTAHRWTCLANVGPAPAGLASHSLNLHYPLGMTLSDTGSTSPACCFLLLAFSGEHPNNEKHSSMYVLTLQSRSAAQDPRLEAIVTQYHTASRGVATVGVKPCRACTMCAVS